MSENTLPLLTSDDELGDDAQPASSRRVLVGLGGLAVVAVAAGALLLTGGGEDDIALGPPPGAPVAPVAAAASPTPSPTPSTPTAATEVTAARNPFAALQLQTGGAPAGGSAGGEVPTGEVPAGTPPSSGSDTAVPPSGDGLVDDGLVDDGLVDPPPGEVVDPPTAGPVPEVPPPSEEPTVSPTPVAHSLVLAAVGGTPDARTATFTVDGTDEVVDVGATFGPGGVLRLLSLQQGPGVRQWTAVLQSGRDEPFDVALGATVALP